MKQLLFASAMALLISCTNGTGGNDHAAVADKNAENTKQVFKAIETGDVSKLDSLFTEDVVDHNASPNGGDIKGRDSVKAMLGQIHTYFDGLKLEMQNHATSADGQYHFVTVRMTGKSKANPWGMPVGMDMDDTSVDVIKLKDGKCSEHWSFMSMGDFQEIMKGMSGGDGNKTPLAVDSTKKVN